MQFKRTLLNGTLFVLAAASTWRCSSFPADGASCPASVCTDHGTCTYKDTYPTCACAEGYTGLACTRCADAFHRASDDSCVADEVCAEGLCAATGTCGIESGKTTCSCQLGFGGATCASCRAGYHEAGDGGCALDQDCRANSCSGAGTCSTDAGRVICDCTTGRTGSACQIAAGSCAATNPCSTNGTCSDREGIVRCICAPGFGGPTCDTCYPGYRATDAGTCVLSDQCLASTCSFAGTCSVVNGVKNCACDTGYTGETCGSCATGFHRAPDFSCRADETCPGSSNCGPNGSCVVANGVAACTCANGYAGLTCSSCYPGFHSQDGGAPDGGTGCVLDTICRPETCRFRGQCNDDAGTPMPTCTCNAGYLGANCQNNVDDCVNSACGRGSCVDLVDSYVCLCDGGVYGQVCP
jgi:hypothetical protein